MLELSNTETLIILSSISIFAYIVFEIILTYSMRRKNRLSKILQINNFVDFLGINLLILLLSIFIAIIYVSLFNYYILIAVIVTIVLVVTKAKLYKYAKGE
jgi:hypothetical protein